MFCDCLAAYGTKRICKVPHLWEDISVENTVGPEHKDF